MIEGQMAIHDKLNKATVERQQHYLQTYKDQSMESEPRNEI